MGQLHIAFVPMIAYGHMIPMLDMAKLFASRGVRVTIIATPAFSDPIIKAQESGHPLELIITQFPPQGSPLPNNMVSFDQATTPDLLTKFIQALAMLQQPVETILQQLQPNCLISDMFFPWSALSAAKLEIPRLVFYGMSSFARCCLEEMALHKPYKTVSSDSEPFFIPNLPHRLTLVRTQVNTYDLQAEESGEDALSKLLKQIKESQEMSYGEVINSFYEVESDYADHFKNVLGKNPWLIGPLLLCNNGDKPSRRGKESAIDEHECSAWLDSKRASSVVYMCFGSMVTFTPAQLHETAVGLEASGQDFIWVVRRGKNQEDNEDWLPEGFEERVQGRGLIIRGWAPQTLILNHPAVGAFVTHCGWNSTLEGICAGVPLVTWPVFAEQFFNEKLVTEVLKIGVSVGNKKWQHVASEGVGREAVTKAVKRVMAGEGAAEMRSRAKYYKEMARKGVEEGGSSYKTLNNLMQELSTYVPPTKHSA